jgi:CheY-like chemotaxis protein
VSQKENSKKPRLLVVDDEAVTLKMTQMALEKMGFTVTIFNHPMRALEFYRENHQEFDLILTDKSMPHMSGIELTKKIREIDSQIPILILTGFASNEEDKIFEEIGVTKALFKPLSMATTYRRN